jgi:hypothetical protein
MKYFLGLLLLTACAAPRPIQEFPVPAEIYEHVETFERACDVRVNLPIDFGSLPPPVIGRCYYSDIYREIELDKDIWPGLDYLQREQLIFHELGHCTLDIDHDNTSLEGGCPASIMYYKLMPQICYKKYREYYIEELCTKN